eukprot:447582_1
MTMRNVRMTEYRLIIIIEIRTRKHLFVTGLMTLLLNFHCFQRLIVLKERKQSYLWPMACAHLIQRIREIIINYIVSRLRSPLAAKYSPKCGFNIIRINAPFMASIINKKMDEGIDECKETQQAIFSYHQQTIYMDVVDCYTTPRTTILMTDAENNDFADMETSSLSGYDVSGYVVLGIVVLFPVVFIMMGYAFHKDRSGTDKPGYLALFTFFASVGDFYTDLLWSITLYSQGNPLYVYAFVFIFVPHMLSLSVGIVFLTKWRQNKSRMYISEYALRFDKVIIISTFLSGFYATTDIVTSHLFHLDVLSLQLDSSQKTQIGNLKIFNTVILENIPCTVIQLIYLKSLGNASIVHNGGLNITILAIAFSVVSIVFGVLTVSVRLFNEFMDRKKESNDINIEFIFKSSEITDFKEYHVHSHQFLSKGISHALHLQKSQIEILHIQKITSGIKVSGAMKYLDMNEMETMVEQLNDTTSELVANFRKECMDRIQIQTSNRITLEITKIKRVTGDAQDIEEQTVDTGASQLKTQIEFNYKIN